MDYQKIYNALTQKKYRNLEVKETHHIKPKSLGGDDSDDNLVDLSPREHFIAHRLLAKITTGEDRTKMVFALWRMSNNGKIKNSKTYETVREEYVKILSDYRTGKKFAKHSDHAREKASQRSIGANNNMYGKKHTEISKKKISESKKGTGVGKDNPFYGKTHTKETIETIARKSSEKQKGIPKSKKECPYCKGLFAANTMSMFHGEKCKSKDYLVQI